MKTKHTPTPWSTALERDAGMRPTNVIRADGAEVAFTNHGDFDDLEEAGANAAFIVKAVNCHDELVELLQDILNHIQDGAALNHNSRIFAEDSPATVVISEALAKAKGDA